MNELDFRPKTRSVPARSNRVGQVVMESYEHPAPLSRLGEPPITKTCTIDARFVWQRDTEPAWRLGTFPRSTSRKGSLMAHVRP